MSDALTTTSSLSTDQTAYDRFTYFALRPELFYDSIADVQPTNLSMPGSPVTFYIASDMAVVSTALNESVDVDAVALADSTATVTLAEYGNVAKTTAKIRGYSYVPLDPNVLNVVAYNAGRSIDTVAEIALRAGDNILYCGVATARNTVMPADNANAATNKLSARARQAVAQLRSASVASIGGAYAGFIHPDVAYDFYGDTGGAGWRDPHTYSAPMEIFNGEVGKFQGVRYMETSRAPLFADAGSSTTLTDVYATLIVGRQALAKAWSVQDGNGPTPRVFPTPIVDNLRRFQGYAWYWLGGYGRFREAAIRRIECSSSIGSNS